MLLLVPQGPRMESLLQLQSSEKSATDGMRVSTLARAAVALLAWAQCRTGWNYRYLSRE